MFETIQYLVSSKKLEDGFGIDNKAVVNGRGKITRSCDDNMGLDEMNQTNDFRLLIDVLRDPRAFHD